MRKSKDISKYDIHWQVRRVQLKQLKTIEEKCLSAESYLTENLNVADKERVLNYLEGLSMAYKGDKRQYILEYRDTLLDVSVSDYNKCDLNFDMYTSHQLQHTANDNWTRCRNYLTKGYRHNELICFTKAIYTYLNDTKKLKQLDKLITDSHKVTNTIQFFF
jgi:hypothetical protein